MKSLHSFLVFLIGCSCLLISCAKVSSPSGGDRDTTPPKILSSTPTIGESNYTQNKIQLTFDEFVEVKNLGQELISSPPFSVTPEYIIKKKTLIMTLPDTLLDNTTYYMNFGKAIVDFNEGNELDSNLFVFSTGETIDSLSLTGKLLHAENLQPVNEGFVMLYPSFEDSLPCKKRPTYFTKTNETGDFTLSFLKDRDYQIFALLDLNSNYRYDLPNESIAFLNEKIRPTKKDTGYVSDSLTLYLFTEDFATQSITTIREDSYGKILVGFRKPISDDSLTLKISANNEVISPSFKEWDESSDSLYLWFAKLDQYDSIEVIAQLPSLSDTSIIYPSEKPDTLLTKKQERAGKEPFNLLLNKDIKKSFYIKDSLILGFNHPITKIDTQFLSLVVDSMEVPFEASIEKGKVKLYADWKPAVEYELQAFPGFASDVFQLENDSLVFRVNPKGEDQFGYIYFSLSGEKKQSVVFQLFSEDGKLTTERICSIGDSISFEYMKPGKYSAKLIYDTVPDGTFTPGKYGTKRLPEKVIYYPQVIEVNPNWELDLTWEL